MPTLQERIANERRRLKSVREKLTAAVNQSSGGDEAWVPFYLAVTDYFKASMGRLHAQDVKMGDMIRERTDTSDPQVKKALSELDERLAGNQAHLHKLVDAAEKLRTDGEAAISRFESVAKDYTDYIVSNMGHHGATTELAGKLFDQDDWVYMAGISDEDAAREEKLYERVTSTTPRDLALSDG